MRAAHITDFKADLDAMLDRVSDDHAPLVVTREGKPSVVVLSEAEWARIEETLQLLASPVNAARLAEAVMDLDAADTDRRERTTLAPGDHAAFFAVLDAPPEPTPALRDALARLGSVHRSGT